MAEPEPQRAGTSPLAEPAPLTLQSILDSIQDVFYRVDPAGRISVVSWSGALEMGYQRPEELVGRPAVELWRDPGQRTAMVEALRRDGVIRDWEIELQRRDGSTLWAATTVHLLRDQAGREAGYQGIWRNIDDRKAAEERIRQSEEQFSQIFRTVPDTIVVSRARDGLLLDVNPGFEHATGWTRAEAVGRSTVALDLWASVEARNQMVADLRATGEVLDREFVFRRKDGTPRSGVFSARTVSLAGELCVVFNMRDITGPRRLEAEHARLEAQLRQAQKLEAVGQVAGGVAHDFNNLLTVQLGSLGMIKEMAGLPAEARTLLDEIELSARAAATLTRQLLAFSRRQVLQVRHLDLNDVVGAFLGMLRRVLREDVWLEVQPSPRPLWLEADAGMLEQVIMNLAVNARDAMPEGGRLTLACDAVAIGAGRDAAPGPYVRLTVADTGQGMEESTLRRIFEPFFTTKAAGHGTGLGLATVYGIVKQHGGFIEVESSVGRGSTFLVHFPAGNAEAAEAASSAPAVAPLGRGETVLLVEDDAAVRQTLSTWLGRLGYRTVTCPDGASALARWRSGAEHIDLVLTDMVMPGGTSGRDLAVQLRAEAPELPVVVMSGHSAELAEVGLPPRTGFLPKPAEPAALAAAVRRELDRAGPR